MNATKDELLRNAKSAVQELKNSRMSREAAYAFVSNERNNEFGRKEYPTAILDLAIKLDDAPEPAAAENPTVEQHFENSSGSLDVHVVESVNPTLKNPIAQPDANGEFPTP